ncbi:MAG TPA: Clp protease N-terminal domain-containing protein, partial [Paludibacter sp.]|nr:Clp protease N-terminal domain-containing protein [Paludibacter sp.]
MNFNNFTIKSQEAVQQAIDLVQSKGQQVVETPHLMKGILLKGEDVTQFLLGKLGVNTTVLQAVIDTLIDGFPRVSGGEPYLSRETNNVLQKAIDKSSKAGDQFVSLEYILLALAIEKNQLTKVLHDAGITE